MTGHLTKPGIRDTLLLQPPVEDTHKMCNTLHTSIVFWTLGGALVVAAVSTAFIVVKKALNIWDIF